MLSSNETLDFWGIVNSLVNAILVAFADILERVFGINIR